MFFRTLMRVFCRMLAEMNSYSNETRRLRKNYGLVGPMGVPPAHMDWAPDFLVESLSDLTIYMSYYTVSHLPHGGLASLLSCSLP